jgi:hypothetical protein
LISCLPAIVRLQPVRGEGMIGLGHYESFHWRRKEQPIGVLSIDRPTVE